MTLAAFRWAAARYRRRVRRLANALPPGAEDDAVALFDALQRQAHAAGGVPALVRYWLAESASTVRVQFETAPTPHGGSAMTWLLRDLRDAWRALRHAPGYASATIAIMALGIGVNTAVFSVLDALLFKALPYAQADRLVLTAEWPKSGGNWTVAPTTFAHWRANARSFTAIEARAPLNVALLDGGDPEEIRGARVTSGYFDVLGIGAVHGRTFGPSDTAGGAPCAAVISHRLWVRRFAADDLAIGRPMRLSGQVCTLVGVLPADSAFDRGAPELFVPLVMSPAEARSEGRMLTAIARLRDGVSLDQARGELAGLAASFNRTRGPAGRDWSADVFPYRDIVVRTDSRQLVWILFAAVGAVLAVACANVAGLSLSRAIGRRREIAVRAALGAGRARVFRALLTESVLLAVVGAAASVIVGAGALRALVALVPPGTLPAEAAPSLDARALGFALVAAIVTGVVAGVIPAWQAGRVTLTEALSSSGRGFTAARGSSIAQSALLVVELALAMVLVTGASLLAVSFNRLVGVAPGFDAGNVLTLRVSAPATRYNTDAQVVSLYDRLRAAMLSVPNVQAAGAATSLPLGGWLFGTPFLLEGQPAPSPVPSAHIQTTTPGYFEALHISLADGRTFTDADTSRAPLVAIVNDTFMRRFAPTGRGVGLHLRLTSQPLPTDPIWEVVGVLHNVKTGGLADGDQATPEIYVPESQQPMPSLFFAIRSSNADPMRLVPAIRSALRAVDAELPIGSVMTMDERLGVSVRSQRFRTAIIAAFAALATLLACLGAYAVRARAVAARIKEMGIRVALGASHGQVVRLSLGQGLRLAAIGLGAGLAASLLLARYIRPWLFDTSTADPWILIGALALLGGTAGLASWLPARRAGAVDPLTVLRNE